MAFGRSGSVSAAMSANSWVRIGVRHTVRVEAGLIDVHISERRRVVVALLLLCNLLTDEVAAERARRGCPISRKSRLQILCFCHDFGTSVVNVLTLGTATKLSPRPGRALSDNRSRNGTPDLPRTEAFEVR